MRWKSSRWKISNSKYSQTLSKLFIRIETIQPSDPTITPGSLPTGTDTAITQGSGSSGNVADEEDGSDTEEESEVDIEALEEDELYAHALGRNVETIDRAGDDYEVIALVYDSIGT